MCLNNNYINCDIVKSIFDNINIYSIMIDISGVIIHASDRFKKFYDVDVIGKKLSDLLVPNTYEEIRKMMLEAIFTSKNSIKEIVFNNKKEFKVEVIPISDKHMKVTHIVLYAIENIDEKKLQSEIDELKQKLEESNSIKSIFLSNISHELRTPMNSIIGFSDFLLVDDNFKNNRFLKSININAKHLDELLNNILDYAKLETNEFDLLYENFSIDDLFQELNDIFQDVNYKKNLDFVKLEFDMNKNKKIISDYLRLKQVLFNIISNSIKFTEKGYIKVSFIEEDDSIIFKVEDSGIGVPKDKVQYIFDRFWQCDSTSRKEYKGVGLGLSISKSIIDMFNGKIWVESDFGKGTIVYVKIPLEEIKENVIVKTKENINFSDKTVLIVDEVPINYSLLSIYLNSIGIKMIMTYNGKDAIKIFKKQKEKIDLIILDINLPDMNGIQLSKMLKEIGDCKIVSKSGSDVKNENADYHLKKPFSKEKLINILKEVW